jgi:hypothetical protein
MQPCKNITTLLRRCKSAIYSDVNLTIVIIKQLRGELKGFAAGHWQSHQVKCLLPVIGEEV